MCQSNNWRLDGEKGVGKDQEASLPNAQFHNPCYEIGHKAEVLRGERTHVAPLTPEYVHESELDRLSWRQKGRRKSWSRRDFALLYVQI